MNYAAGLSAVRQRDYLLGTAVGIVPATVGYTALGAYGASPLSRPFAAAVLAVVMVSLAGRLRSPTAEEQDGWRRRSDAATLRRGNG